jgi:hypothetical protein
MVDADPEEHGMVAGHRVRGCRRLGRDHGVRGGGTRIAVPSLIVRVTEATRLTALTAAAPSPAGSRARD